MGSNYINEREIDLEMNRLINKCVDSVFRKYNRGGDGRMTKDETLQFIRDTITNIVTSNHNTLPNSAIRREMTASKHSTPTEMEWSSAAKCSTLSSTSAA